MILNLYVSQIPYKTAESEIYEHFTKFGSVKNLSIAKGKGNWNKLNAKIDLQSSHSYKFLFSKSHFLGGKRVIVDRFLTGGELEKKNKSVGQRRVSLFGIKGSVTSKDVLHFLSCFGEIESHHFIKYKDKRNKKYGFVTFEHEESARRCVGCKTIQIKGVAIKIKPYKVKSSEENQEEPFEVRQGQSFNEFSSYQRNNLAVSEQTHPSPKEAKRKVFGKKKRSKRRNGLENQMQHFEQQAVKRIIQAPVFEREDRVNNTVKEILRISSWIDEYHCYENVRLNNNNNQDAYFIERRERNLEHQYRMDFEY